MKTRLLKTNTFLIFISIISISILSACKSETNINNSPGENASPVNVDEITEPVDTISEVVVDSADPTIISDFETGDLDSGLDENAKIGFVTWSDGSEVSLELFEFTSELSAPSEIPQSKRALAVSVDIKSGGWAGMAYSFTNESLDQWVSQDWSLYAGVSFWIYGRGTEGQILFEILENRNPDSTTDDAERWNLTILDDFSGWKYFEVPFEEFNRKDVGNGAPNDGLALEEVHGFAFGGFGLVGMGDQTYLIDDIKLYGVAPERPVTINFDKLAFSAKESGLSKIRIVLNKPSENVVSIDIHLAEGHAIVGEDFLMEQGTVVFAAGETSQTVEVITIDDSVRENQEQVILSLSNPVGAELGAVRRAVFTIRDNDPVDPLSIYNFDASPGLLSFGEMNLSLFKILDTDEMALETQQGVNTVLLAKGEADKASFGQLFAQEQNWDNYSGLQFWMYGSNSGIEFDLNVLYNKTEESNKEMELVWSDEFNGDANQSPDFLVWHPELGDGKLNNIEGWGNAQREYSTANLENLVLDGNGNLVMTAQKIDQDNSLLHCWYGPCEYSAVRLMTAGSAEFQYGRFEARIKMPSGKGFWPAFWMLGTNIDDVGWPQSGEIDIMEYIGHETDTIYGSLHGPGYSGINNLGEPKNLLENDFTDDFHVFSIEWTAEEITWLLDGEVYHSVSPADLPEDREWVYDQPFFILLNFAVGGYWPGNPDSSTEFPAEVVVDYVRVYQASANYETNSYTVSDDFEGWQLIEIPFEDMSSTASNFNSSDVWGYQFELGVSEVVIDNFGFVE